jgi:TonB family protein
VCANLANDGKGSSHDSVVTPFRATHDLVVFCVSQDPAVWAALTAALPAGTRARQADRVDQVIDALLRRAAPAVLFLDTATVTDVPVEMVAIGDLPLPTVSIEIAATPIEEIVLETTARVAIERLPRALNADRVRHAFERARNTLEVRTQHERAAPPPPTVPTTGVADGGAVANYRWRIVSVVAACVLLIGAIVAWYFTNTTELPSPHTNSPAPPASGEVARVGASAEGLESVLERARAAMLERRYLAPRDDNALIHYRHALQLAPNNPEALQGLERLTGVLLERAESAFAQRQFDAALIALEGARELAPNDPRIGPLDARVNESRGKFLEAQVRAALNVDALDRASALLDGARESGGLSADALQRLRNDIELRRRSLETERVVERFERALRDGKLLVAEAGNAHEPLGRLATLDAARARTARARLAQRLLEEARRRIAAGEAATAEPYLEAAVANGAAPTAVAQVQRSLTAARERNLPRTDVGSVSERAPTARAPTARSTDNAAPVRSVDPGTNRTAETPAVTAPVAGSIPISALTPVRRLQPRYPRIAERQRTEGWVEVEFTVAADGAPTDAVITSAQPQGVFDESALQAVAAAKFQPYRVNGVVTTPRVRVRLAFKAP